MKRLIKVFGLACACILITLLINETAFAEGSLSASLDKESCALSEAVTLSISATSDDGSTTPPQISIEYDANRLDFVNCSTEYGGGGGYISLTETEASLDFNTLSGGPALINITAVLNDDSTDIQTSSVSVMVDGEDIAAGMEQAASEGTGVSEGSVDTGDGRMIQAVFPAEFMPVLFHKATVDYQGQTVECAQFDMGDISLLYNTDQTGNDGKFMIYNSATGELNEFRMIQGIENRYIIVLNEAQLEVPAGYTKAVLDWNGQTLTAYMDVNSASGNAEAVDGVSPADFFLIYAISSDGNRGWYQYDQSEGTYQRFNAAAAGMLDAGSDFGALKGSASSVFLDEYLSRTAQMIISFVLLGLTIILIIVVIVLAVKLARSDDAYVGDYYGYEEDDEEEDDEDDEEVMSGRRKSVTAASIVSEQMSDDEESEDEESEDDEEMEEEEDYFSPRLSKKEQKALEKERKRAEKEAAKEEKWRLKEEKRAEKMRKKGYAEASPMDWSSFNDGVEDDEEDDRRPVGRSKLPKYMRNEEMDDEETEVEESEDDEMMEMSESEMEEEDAEAEEPEEDEDDEDDEETIRRDSVQKLPPRKANPELNERIEAENAKALKEDELRRKQKRLFEQQQKIEEARRIEEEERARAAKMEQEKFILSQQEDEDLDEDFQFEFLNIK